MIDILFIIIGLSLILNAFLWRDREHLKKEVDYYRQTDQLKDDLKEEDK
jgi:hypothetical protein